MYKCYYDYLKAKFKDKIDTDRFVLHIETEDFKDISNDVHDWLDTSKYLKSLNLLLEYGVNKKIIVKIKDELYDGFMKEFIAIAPKVYGFKHYKHDGTINELKKAKGKNKCVTDKTLNFDHLKQCLFNNIQ